MDIQEQFKLEFNNAFSWLNLASERGKDLQIDLEMTNDALAGPLDAILIDGNCDYVFKDTKGIFSGVSTIEGFHSWALEIAEEFRKGVESFETLNIEETEDKAKLLEVADAMRRVSDLAYQILEEREKR